MPVASGTKTLLGFAIDDSELAVAKRENPKGPGYADPEDLSLLENLRILYKARGVYKKHPLIESNPEEIRQFFRWALSAERHPLPPIVRRILCMKRAYLTEGIDSMRTVPGHRTTERILLAEIDKLLHDDGVKNVVNACMADIRTGFWSAPKLPTPPPSTPAPAACPPAACGPEDLAKLEALQGEVEALRVAVASSASSVTTNKNSDVASLRLASQTLQEEGLRLQKELEALRKASANTAAAKNAEIEKKEDAFTDVQDKLAEAKAAKKKLAKKLMKQTEDHQAALQSALDKALREAEEARGRNVGEQRAAVEEANQRIAGLTKQLGDVERQRQELIEAHQRELAALQTQLQTRETELQDAEVNVDAARTTLEEAQAQSMRKNANLVARQAAIDTAQESLRNAEANRDRLVEEHEVALEALRGQLREDLDAQREAHEAALQTSQQRIVELELSLLEAEKGRRGDVGNLQAELEVQRQAVGNAEQRIGEMDQLREELEATRDASPNELAELQQRLQTSAQELEDLRAAQAEKNRRIAELQTSQDSQQTAMTALQQELEALRAQKTSSNADKNRQIQDLQAQLDALQTLKTSSNTNKNRRIAELEQQIQTSQDLQRQLEQSRAALQAATQERNQAQANLASARVNSERKNQTITNKNGNLATARASLVDANATLQRIREEHTQELNRVREELAGQLATQIGTREQRIKELEGQLETLQAEKARNAERIQQLDGKMTTLNQEIQGLVAEMTAQKEEITQLRGIQTNLEASKQDLETRLAETIEMNKRFAEFATETLERKESEGLKRIQMLEEQLRKRNQELEASKGERKPLTEVYEKQREKIKELEQTIQQLTASREATERVQSLRSAPVAPVVPTPGLTQQEIEIRQDESVQKLAQVAKSVVNDNKIKKLVNNMEIRTRAYKSSVVKSLLLDALQVAVGKPREEAEPLVMSAINKARKYSNYLPDKLRPHVVLGKDKTLGYEGVQAYLLELAKPIVGGKTTRRRTPRKNTRSSRKTRRRQHRK